MWNWNVYIVWNLLNEILCWESRKVWFFTHLLLFRPSQIITDNNVHVQCNPRTISPGNNPNHTCILRLSPDKVFLWVPGAYLSSLLFPLSCELIHSKSQNQLEKEQEHSNHYNNRNSVCIPSYVPGNLKCILEHIDLQFYSI